ncbi:MAG: hypothetical protein Q9201_004577 [Fulgogasparrea decipioides]
MESVRRSEPSFLVQSRGNGWADTFDLGNCGVLINIAALNKVEFNSDKTRATIQGGALVHDMINAAYGNDTRFANPTCRCLGFLGSSLGGGINRVIGVYGMGVDQVVSANVVTASGQSLLVDETHSPDLWYAMRGAAPNFGIATSAVVKAYPIPQSENIAWEGALTFSDDKLEALIKAIYDLDLKPRMQIDVLFSTSGPPSYKPSITAVPFYLGDAAAAQKAFASILRIGPTSNGATELPYSRWGEFGDSFCQKGQRKPAYGASLSRQALEPKTWRAIYNEFKNFVAAHPQAANSSVLAEYYPVQKAMALGGTTSSSYPFRDVPIHVATIPVYADSSLDVAANAFASRVRDLMRSVDGLARNTTYINFAHGDEPLEEVYGDSLAKLQALKKRYDPLNRFNQWFPLA